MADERVDAVSLSERELGYRRLGAGPPLLLLNGYAATKADWDPSFLKELTAGHEVICLDHRGVGDSSPADEPFGVADLAADAADAVEALELGRPSVLGWSMGGYVAQVLALEHPGRVGRLVLLSTDPGGAGAVQRAPEIEEKLFEHSGTPREQARRLISLLFPPEMVEAVDAQFGELVAEARAALSTATLHSQEDAMREWSRAGVAARLGELELPVLVAAGMDDVVIPTENSLVLAEGIAGAWLARYGGGAHAFMAQRPSELGRLVKLFLESAG